MNQYKVSEDITEWFQLYLPLKDSYLGLPLNVVYFLKFPIRGSSDKVIRVWNTKPVGFIPEMKHEKGVVCMTAADEWSFLFFRKKNNYFLGSQGLFPHNYYELIIRELARKVYQRI